MPTTIRTREPRELLSLIPYQLGFRPEESAVVVSLRGERSRTGLVARVDLADLADPDQGPHVARALVQHLVADGARGVVLVLYTAQDVAAAGRRSAERVRAHLEDAAEHFLGPVPCWVVGPRGYRALGCADPACCPPGGRPLSDLESTEVSAEMVACGTHVAASREELGRVTPAPSPARRSARRAADRWAARARGARSAGDLSRWRREGLLVWAAELERALVEVGAPVAAGDVQGEGAARGPHTWEQPAPPVLGRLRAALDDLLVRDAVLLSFVPGTERVAERVVAGDAGPDVGAALRTIVDPVRGRAPDPARVAAARAVLVEVAAHASRGRHAPTLTLLGVLAWWEGDGARSTVLLEQALAVEPGYRLALLVQEALDHGMPPGWLRRARPGDERVTSGPDGPGPGPEDR